MEKPPMKKRQGPYGKRNYDSELQPIPLTLENPETNTCILESTSTLQDTYCSISGTRDVTEVFHSFDLKIYPDISN